MCVDAGLEKKTNHSLRATGATAMFTAGVPEKIIKSVTGHKYSKALELYERPTVDQMKAVSKVMTNPNSSFSCEVEQLQSSISKDNGNIEIQERCLVKVKKLV